MLLLKQLQHNMRRENGPAGQRALAKARMLRSCEGFSPCSLLRESLAVGGYDGQFCRWLTAVLLRGGELGWVKWIAVLFDAGAGITSADVDLVSACKETFFLRLSWRRLCLLRKLLATAKGAAAL